MSAFNQSTIFDRIAEQLALINPRNPAMPFGQLDTWAAADPMLGYQPMPTFAFQRPTEQWSPMANTWTPWHTVPSLAPGIGWQPSSVHPRPIFDQRVDFPISQWSSDDGTSSAVTSPTTGSTVYDESDGWTSSVDRSMPSPTDDYSLFSQELQHPIFAHSPPQRVPASMPTSAVQMRPAGDGDGSDSGLEEPWPELRQRRRRAVPKDYICHNCYRPGHDVRDCPKPLSEYLKLSPYQGSKPCVGEYYCKKCKRYWLSHNSGRNKEEECKKCGFMIRAKKQFSNDQALRSGLYDKPKYRKYKIDMLRKEGASDHLTAAKLFPAELDALLDRIPLVDILRVCKNAVDIGWADTASYIREWVRSIIA